MKNINETLLMRILESNRLLQRTDAIVKKAAEVSVAFLLHFYAFQIMRGDYFSPKIATG